jgi:putative ABC transport system permease protein
MSYSLATLWFDRQRYVPGVLAVAFSALLIALQCGLLLGLFSITSLPIDRTNADVWVGSPKVLSVDLGRAIPEGYLSRVATVPGVRDVEVYLQGFSYWKKPNGGNELCMVIGARLSPDAMGLLNQLKDRPHLQALLTEPGAIIMDVSEVERLGIKEVGDTATISGERVRLVATLRGIKSLAGPYVFCSVETARRLLRYRPDETTYLLARCDDPGRVAEELNAAHPDDMLAFTSSEFSYRSRMHWLTKTKAGIALGFAAALGLLVGAVVTSQTLYAATAASLREYAVLRALGIPRWRMAMTVLMQSFWVGVFGVGLGLPTAFLLSQGAEQIQVPLPLPWWLPTAAAVITLAMAVLSGLTALRSLRLVEPAVLLR